MADHASNIRNVALVGHGDSGKTTFVEHALKAAGLVTRVGSVLEGTTVCDFDPDERERQHSIDTACAHLPWQGVQLQFVDCPGYPDFRGVATEGLASCDLILFFVNAVGGMGVNTRMLWRRARAMGKACMLVISKMDADNADPGAVLESIQERFGASCLPYNLPIGSGKTFKGVVNCVGPEKNLTEDTAIGDPESARAEFLETVVESDDALMEKYLEEEEITREEKIEAFRSGLRAGSLTPVVFLASTTAGGGLEQLLDLLVLYAPSAEKPVGVAATGPDGTAIELSADGPFVASVFKVTSDVHVGKLSYLRVWSGSLPADGVVWSSDKDGTVKLAHPSRPQGKELEPLKAVGPGDVFCVAKIEDLRLGGSVSSPKEHITVAGPTFRPSMVHVAVSPRARGDEHKIGAALQKISDEDPCFTAARDPETNDLVVAGRSSLHLDLMLKRMTTRYKVEVDTALPRVPLKETVTGNAEGHHRHKKQTGGRGQFAEVYLRLFANERGEGFEFKDKTVGGSIPKNFIPAIEKGIREIMAEGVVAGYRVVDVRVEVYDGKFHPVDSSEAAFKMAGNRAFRDAFTKAGPALLEPIMNVEIDIPSQYMGDISGDINTRRGRIMGMEAEGNHQIIRVQVPLKEVQTYSTDLRSMTSGRGIYSMEFDHLDVVPSHVAKGMIEAYKASRSSGD